MEQESLFIRLARRNGLDVALEYEFRQTRIKLECAIDDIARKEKARFFYQCWCMSVENKIYKDIVPSVLVIPKLTEEQLQEWKRLQGAGRRRPLYFVDDSLQTPGARFSLGGTMVRLPSDLHIYKSAN